MVITVYMPLERGCNNDFPIHCAFFNAMFCSNPVYLCDCCVQMSDTADASKSNLPDKVEVLAYNHYCMHAC